MGCHCWIYRKVSSISNEDLIKTLKKEKESYDRGTQHWRIPMEEYVETTYNEAVELVAQFKPWIEDGTMSPLDPQWIGANEDLDKDNIRNQWKQWHEEDVENNRKLNVMVSELEAGHQVDPQEYRDLMNEFSFKPFLEHKGTWYMNTIFDTYFRCYAYSEDEYFTEDELIKYLESVHENMIEQYGEFINGKWTLWKPECYKKGLTPELRKLIHFLYVGENILIHFG